MYLQSVKSRNAVSYYAAKTVYEGGKKTSHVVEKLGKEKELSEKYADVQGYLKQRIAELTKAEKDAGRAIMVRLTQGEQIAMDKRVSYNCGYLILQKIYSELKLNRICGEISKKYKYEYDLSEIVSSLASGCRFPNRL